MKSIPAAIVASAAGLIVLLGMFFPASLFASLRFYALELAIILGVFASLIAISNLIIVHWNKIFSEPKQSIYSAVLLAGFLCVFFAGMIFKPSNLFFKNFSSTVIFTVESSLLAVLAVSLAIACFNLFKRRKSGMGIIFALSTIIFLLSLSGVLASGNQVSLMMPILATINELPIAGARGILLGISIGAIITGLRVLMGIERPYGG